MTLIQNKILNDPRLKIRSIRVQWRRNTNKANALHRKLKWIYYYLR